MKRYALVLLLVAGCGGTVPPEAERLYTLGTERAAEGDHRGAASAFEAVLETGWASAALYLHLAEAYAEAGDAGRARLAVERAARLDRRSGTVRAAQGRLARATGEPPHREATLTGAVAARAAERLGSTALSGLGYGLWLALLCVLAVLVWYRPRGVAWRGAAVGLAVVVVAILILAALVARYEHRPYAVVLTEAPLRLAPSADAGVAETLPAGRRLRLAARDGDWRAVRLPDGSRAWVEAALVADV